MVKSTKAETQNPLRLHASGNWRKKIRGRDHYFGKDLTAALAEYQRVRQDLEAGRTPQPATFGNGGADVTELCNRFLTDAKSRRDGGELKNRSFDD